MYSIRHIANDGVEKIEAAVVVSFNPKEEKLTGYSSDDKEVFSYSSGRAFVMNEHGKTVAVYNLNK